jgi:hypothetical protein
VNRERVSFGSAESLRVTENGRTEITHLKLDEDFLFNESDAKDILLSQDQARHLHEEKKEIPGADIGVPCENSSESGQTATIIRPIDQCAITGKSSGLSQIKTILPMGH